MARLGHMAPSGVLGEFFFLSYFFKNGGGTTSGNGGVVVKWLHNSSTLDNYKN